MRRSQAAWNAVPDDWVFALEGARVPGRVSGTGLLGLDHRDMCESRGGGLLKKVVEK